MNLTLFPVAAFLLLLSGIGAPAPVPGQAENSAALMRVLFGRWDPARTGTRPCVFQATQAGRGNAASANAGCGVQPLGLHRRRSELDLAGRVQVAPGAFDQKQYRTRFGFAEGAYLALGPPVSGLSPRP